MSPSGRTGSASWVMQEALRQTLPEEEPRRRKTMYNKETKKYEVAQKQKLRKLQFVLEKTGDRNDNVWVGDTALSNSRKHIRIWFQNVNGLVKRNDIQEFQYNIAKMADAGVNVFAFTETNLNTNSPGLSNKIVESFKHVIPNGYFRLNNQNILRGPCISLGA